MPEAPWLALQEADSHCGVCSTFGTWPFWFTLGFVALFGIDMWVSTRLAYEKDEALMFNVEDIQSNYVRCASAPFPLPHDPQNTQGCRAFHRNLRTFRSASNAQVRASNLLGM